MAYVILRTAVSAIVQNFDVEFVPGETPEDFDEQFIDTFLLCVQQL